MVFKNDYGQWRVNELYADNFFPFISPSAMCFLWVLCTLNFGLLKVRAVCTSPLVGEVAMSASEMAGEGLIGEDSNMDTTGEL
jgi:hypothetical protein